MQNYFFIRIDYRYHKVRFADIHYVEACKNYVTIVTNEKSHLILITLKQIEKILPREQFCRVHRSFIVSLAQMEGFDQESVYIPGRSIPIGEQYFEKLKNCVQVVIPIRKAGHQLSRCTTETLLSDE